MHDPEDGLRLVKKKHVKENQHCNIYLKNVFF